MIEDSDFGPDGNCPAPLQLPWLFQGRYTTEIVMVVVMQVEALLSTVL